jgi:hypothetical protein
VSLVVVADEEVRAWNQHAHRPHAGDRAHWARPARC